MLAFGRWPGEAVLCSESRDAQKMSPDADCSLGCSCMTFSCVHLAASVTLRRETKRNADLYIPDEMISASYILVPKTRLSAVFY